SEFTSNAQTVANVEDEATGNVAIGSAAEGGVVTADVTGLSDADGGITGHAYQWQSSSDGTTWTNIAGATGASYNLPGDQSLVGQQVHVVVTTTDSFGGTSEFTSNAQ